MQVTYLHKTEPYKHQADAFYFSYGKPYFALFMEMGLGKSKCLIDIASNLHAEGKLSGVLLIAPNGVHEQWANEQLPEHSPVAYSTFVFDSATFGNKGTQREWRSFIQPHNALRWLCVNVEAFSYPTYLNEYRTFLQSGPCMVAVDEASRIKTPSAARTINIIQGLADLTKARRTIVALKPLSAYRAILTGTPVTNSPYDLFSMTDFLKHNYFGLTFNAFRARYGLEKLDKVPNSTKVFRRRISLDEMQRIRSSIANGGKVSEVCAYMGLDPLDVLYIVQHPNITVPYKNLAELKEKIKPFAFIARKEDCLDLPDKVYEKVIVHMSAEQKAVYKELCDNMFAEYSGKELTVLTKLALLTRLSQVAGGFFPHNDEPGCEAIRIGTSNPKIDAVISTLDECSMPVVITARFTSEIDALYDAVLDRTELRVAKVHGKVANNEREAAIEAFQSGTLDVLVGSAGTIGIGRNLQAASTMLIYSNDYSIEKRGQLEDRIHRIGQKNECTYVDFITLGTVDTKIIDALRLKKDLLDYMQGGSVEEFIR